MRSFCKVATAAILMNAFLCYQLYGEQRNQSRHVVQAMPLHGEWEDENAASIPSPSKPLDADGLLRRSLVDTDAWPSMRKVKIHFLRRDENGQHVACKLREIKVDNAREPRLGTGKYPPDLVGNHSLEGAGRLEGTHGVIFGVVPSDYKGPFSSVLLEGNAYRIECGDLGFPAEFEVPNDWGTNKVLRVDWVLNEGVAPSEDGAFGHQITGRVLEKLPNIGAKWTATYWDPESDRNTVPIREDGTFAVPAVKPGGTLVVGAMEREMLVLFYKADVRTNEVTFPVDADHVFREEESVECQLKINTKLVATGNIAVIGLYVNEQDVFPVVAVRVGGDTDRANAFRKTSTIKLRAAPGQYIAKVLGVEEGEYKVKASSAIVVRAGEANDFLLE